MRLAGKDEFGSERGGICSWKKQSEGRWRVTRECVELEFQKTLKVRFGVRFGQGRRTKGKLFRFCWGRSMNERRH